MDDEKRAEARKRFVEDRNVSEADGVRGLTIQRALEKGARR